MDGTSVAIGKPGVIEEATASPDGRYALISAQHKPYSYLLPYEMFPLRVSVVDLSTGSVKELSDRALQDSVPNIHDAVFAGPREYQWRSDAPSTVFWVEAGDGGDPRKEAAVRDTLYLLDAPFTGGARKLAELPIRFRSVTWSEKHTVLVEERRWKDRARVILAVSVGAPVKLFEGSFEDRYNDPGTAVSAMNGAGKPVAVTTPDGSGVFLRGEGASAEGDKPFVAVMNLANGSSKKIWGSEKGYFEFPWDVIDAGPVKVLVRKESPTQSPNYYLWSAGQALQQVTAFPSPYGNATLPTKQVLKYKRADGVELSANLYLPAGYKKEDGPLPTLMEAYPTEFKTKASAGQITGSPYEFTLLYWGSPIPFVTQGYAVLENASIPIIGEGNAEPNDTYVEQLVASAQAAIDEGARLGVVDRNRVAVMGHSYGGVYDGESAGAQQFVQGGDCTKRGV